jgi:hypothetical protein
MRRRIASMFALAFIASSNGFPVPQVKKGKHLVSQLSRNCGD